MSRVTDRFFGGAGVIVRKPGNTENGAVEGGSITVVETAYAKQVSDCLRALRDVFEGSVDYLSKYAFYGRLVDAANERIALGDGPEGILGGIVDEACAIASEMGAHLYFAYGSNMDVDQMGYRCPKAVFAGTATLRDHEFRLDSAGVATITECPGSVVRGVLWLIARSDERALDRYEGVASGCYRKVTLPVEGDIKGSMPSLAYVSNRDAHDGATYRSDYMEGILRSARQFGFEERYIGHLEEC